MFDIDWQELFVIIVVAVVVLGPKDLPVAIRTITRMIRKLRAMAGEFQRSMDEVIREAELDDIRNEIRKASEVDIGKAIEKSIDPTGSIAREIDMSSLQTDLERAMKPIEQASPEAAPPAALPVQDQPPALPPAAVPAAEAEAGTVPAEKPAGGGPADAPETPAQRRSAG